MSSKVYHINFRTTFQENITDKLYRLMVAAGLENIISKHDLTAIKLHFGESGNTAFIKPVYVRKIVEVLHHLGAAPFLTDTNTLYKGTRSNSQEHMKTAIHNGFAYSVVNAPVIIADGLRGNCSEPVSINEKHFTSVHIASDINHADAMICLSHFKGHELSGFGGALKNLGMGCAARKGKLQMHSTVSPKIIRKKCVGCGDCVSHCPVEAIRFNDKKAFIDDEKCIGCGDCIVVCQHNAALVRWNQTVPDFLEKMMEYAKGAIGSKANKVLYVNFICDVSPLCDCISHNDVPIVPDIGILASTDPVAIDMASVDLVNQAHGNPGSCLKSAINPGDDKFSALHPKIDWKLQTDYAEKIGLGSTHYELEFIDTKGLIPKRINIID
jgi:hypothetical protein